MRVIRVYDRTDTFPEELRHVVSMSVTRAGALAVELEHSNQPGTMRGVIFAPAEWLRAEDWNGSEVADDPDDLADDPDDLAEQVGPPLAAAILAEREQDRGRVLVDEPTDPRPAGLLPGHVQLPGESLGIVRDPLALSNATRLRHALEVYCGCARLRCPEIAAWRGSEIGTLEIQCQLPDLHDGPHHAAEPSVWLWGPHNHHPHCPRNPAQYNAHVGEQLCGRPLEVSGVPIVGTGCLLPWDHTGAHDYSSPELDGRATPPGAGLTDPTGRDRITELWRATVEPQRERVSAASALRSAGLIGAAETLSPVWPIVHPGTDYPTPEQPAQSVWDGLDAAIRPALSGLVLPRPVTDPALRDGEPPTPAGWFTDRTIGQQCDALYGPVSAYVCDRPAGHDSGPHAHFTPDGGLIQW